MNQKSLIVELAEVIARHWPGRGHVLQRLARALVPHPGTFIVTLLVVGAVLFAQQAGALPFRAPMLVGDSTTTISYQGRLADSIGNPVTTSGVGMQFRLYNTDTGGSPLWEESHPAVPVEDGLFHVLLGSTNPIPVSLLANNSTLWLGITVGADSEMTPREQIASVPYAMIASTVPDGSVTTAKIADGAVTSAKLNVDNGLGMNGNLTVTGNVTLAAGWKQILFSDPGNYDFSIVHNGGSSLDFRSPEYAGGTTAMSIANSGNVGIGTTDPKAKLEIQGCGSECTLLKMGSYAAGGRQYIQLDVENSDPPSTSCDEASEIGRMTFRGDTSRLFICASLPTTGHAWKSVPLN